MSGRGDGRPSRVAGARARPPVAVVLSRFPRVTETFILREVIELERQGQPVVLAPLIRERPPVVHPEARPWLGRARFTPFLSPEVIGSNLRALARRPGLYLRLVARLVLGAARRPEVLAKSLALFPKSVYLAERLDAEGACHVHAHFATYPASTARVVRELTGIPYSLTIHAHDIFVDRTLLGPNLRGAAFVRCISEFNRRFLAERHPEVADRLRVVHVGVDPAAYEDRRATPEGPPPGPERRTIRVLTVAALEPYKGIDVLIEAAARLRDRSETGRAVLRYEVLGEGAERRRLEAAVARAGLEDVDGPGAEDGAAFRLRGAVPQGEVARRLAAADLFVLPSVVAADGQMEGIPVALMEAMASGLPVVASDLSGIPELVEDGVTGLLVPPGDAGALADAVERLTGDLEAGGALCRRLGAAGRDRVVERFSLEATVRELLGLLDRATEGDALPSWVLRELGPLGGDVHSGKVAVRRVHRRPDSTVWEVSIPQVGSIGGLRELVIKAQRSRPGQSASPHERARREHALLERLWIEARSESDSGREGPRWGVPRPLALLNDRLATGDERVLVMERAAGRSLDSLVRELRFRPDTAPLERAFAAAGGWLRWFQGVVGSEQRHGDLWPGNVWIDPATDGEPRVEVIDFEGSGAGTPWDDAAWFLVHARRYFCFPGLGRRFARLERAFLEGFRATAPTAAERAALRAAEIAVRREVVR